MPLIECYVNDFSEQLALKFESAITASIRESVAQAFPPELGYKPGTPEYEVGLDVSRKIMPGWTWVATSPMKWSIQGKRVENGIVARIHILVLESALESQYKNHILEAVTKTAKEVLGAGGKTVHLAISMVEGGVDMTLPRQLFEGLTHGAPEELLQVSDVTAFLREEIVKELQARKLSV